MVASGGLSLESIIFGGSFAVGEVSRSVEGADGRMTSRVELLASCCPWAIENQSSKSPILSIRPTRHRNLQEEVEIMANLVQWLEDQVG